MSRLSAVLVSGGGGDTGAGGGRKRETNEEETRRRRVKQFLSAHSFGDPRSRLIKSDTSSKYSLSRYLISRIHA